MIRLRGVSKQFDGKRKVTALLSDRLDHFPDELSGNFDTATGSEIPSCSRTIHIRDGRVFQDIRR